MDKLPNREIVLTVIFCIALTALVMQIAQCITAGLTGGIPEEEAEDENINLKRPQNGRLRLTSSGCTSSCGRDRSRQR